MKKKEIFVTKCQTYINDISGPVEWKIEVFGYSSQSLCGLTTEEVSRLRDELIAKTQTK